MLNVIIALMIQNTLDNNSTKKYLLQSKGRTFGKVESRMKYIEIENSFTNKPKYEPMRNETQNVEDMVLTLRKEIMLKNDSISK